MMIKLLLTYLLIHWLKGSGPKVTFWLGIVETVILFVATLPVLLWAIDSGRARRVLIDQFNALPLLSRLGGTFIPLWTLLSSCKEASKVKEHQFLVPYIPEEKWVAITAVGFVGAMYITSLITKGLETWRAKRALRAKKKEMEPVASPPQEPKPSNPSAPECIEVFSINFQSLKRLSVSVANLVLQDPTHYLVEYFKFVRYYVEKCGREMSNAHVKLKDFDEEILEFLSKLRGGKDFPIVPTDVELLSNISQPEVEFEYILGPEGLEFVGHCPDEIREDPTKHLVISFYGVFETLSSSLKGGDKEAALQILGAEIEKVRTKSWFT